MDLGGSTRSANPLSYPSEDRTVATLNGMLEVSAARFAGLEALVDAPVRLTYAQLREAARQVTRALMAYGVETGDRIAVWAPNRARWVVIALGALGAGATLVPINTRYKGEEAGYILSKSGAGLLFVDDGFLGNRYLAMLRGEAAGTPARPVPGLERLRTVVALGPTEESAATSWRDFTAAAGSVLPEDAEARSRSVRPDDVSDIVFTSGTTGAPKGAVTTHGQNLEVYRAYSAAIGLTEGDRYLVVNPFFHTFGYKAGVLTSLIRGATVIPQAVFDVDRAFALIESERVTVLPGPPTLYAALLASPNRARHDLTSLRLAITGASVVPPALIERIRSELTFRIVLTGYGLTETCGTVSVASPADDLETLATTSGPPIPGVDVKVVDAEGRAVPTGAAGEVLVRGYNVMRGYFEDPGATAATVDAAGWLHTGDVGTLDARGYIRITDRIKDVFQVGGFNVYPAEVESVLAAHPAVSELAVIAVADERLGEVGRAYVIPRPGAHPTEEELIGYCREHLANFKVPRSIALVDDLPRGPTGKILKRALRTDVVTSPDPAV